MQLLSSGRSQLRLGGRKGKNRHCYDIIQLSGRCSTESFKHGDGGSKAFNLALKN